MPSPSISLHLNDWHCAGQSGFIHRISFAHGRDLGGARPNGADLFIRIRRSCFVHKGFPDAKSSGDASVVACLDDRTKRVRFGAHHSDPES